MIFSNIFSRCIFLLCVSISGLFISDIIIINYILLFNISVVIGVMANMLDTTVISYKDILKHIDYPLSDILGLFITTIVIFSVSYTIAIPDYAIYKMFSFLYILIGISLLVGYIDKHTTKHNYKREGGHHKRDIDQTVYEDN